ncbi:hypothetical protein J4E90_009035 [Alternaria incomplexa]|uniref:uncharacterized protein n=1 Tax=Alternaria incomplexa TaxID=1187928 RepID=UPI00221F24B2|nr:uncharacterized protein J4E90_009035 [Alternaria incomplexa]XP_051301362.1 uncharacterized protein J4E86_007242 [Alternaria arbusti]KAI4908410.1 hypothetical protein J4E90_009035 [Alternaria incomplexa]KAI4951826.1 hypothetical protein J4E86_007242 [Alternaria arbusti]
MAGNAPNVWTQMNYVPPRGQCNHKPSLLAAKCPCLRFMLHPLKSSSSYECDGCGHHASFHTMENKTEDEIRKRWEVEAKERTEQEAQQPRPKKRVRAIEYNNEEGVEDIFNELLLQEARTKKAAPKKRTGRAAGTRAKGKISEILEDDVVELD